MKEQRNQAIRRAHLPYISFFRPTEILALGREAGFRDVQHVSAAALAERYFADRTEIFVHFTGIPGQGECSLRPGAVVEFDIVEGPRGRHAVQVRLINS